MTGVLGCDVGQDDTRPALGVTVEEVYRAYQQNEARANETYKGRDLRVSFRVSEIEDRHVVQNLGYLDKAILELPKERLVGFDVGDRGTATCRLRGFALDTWLRFDCR